MVIIFHNITVFYIFILQISARLAEQKRLPPFPLPFDPGRNHMLSVLQGVVQKAINLSLAHSKSDETWWKHSEMRESNINVTTEKQKNHDGHSLQKYLSKKICLLLQDNEEEWKADFHLQKSFIWKLIFATE